MLDHLTVALKVKLKRLGRTAAFHLAFKLTLHDRHQHDPANSPLSQLERNGEMMNFLSVCPLLGLLLYFRPLHYFQVRSCILISKAPF